jgi:CRP-like cAMP-binding protein
LLADRVEAAASLSPAAVDAWRQHALATRLWAAPEELLEGAIEVHMPSGATLYPGYDRDGPLLALVVEGLARVYTMSAKGRQVTIRYVADGDVFGVPVALAPRIVSARLMLGVQALTPCHVVRLSLTRFREVAGRHAENMWPLFEELARSLMEGNAMLAENVFLPVRARVARHLLDLAVRHDHGLVVHASQQDIADAIGSVREVVSRAVLRMRDGGLIHRDGAVYVIDDVAGLHAVATEPA